MHGREWGPDARGPDFVRVTTWVVFFSESAVAFSSKYQVAIRGSMCFSCCSNRILTEHSSIVFKLKLGHGHVLGLRSCHLLRLCVNRSTPTIMSRRQMFFDLALLLLPCDSTSIPVFVGSLFGFPMVCSIHCRLL